MRVLQKILFTFAMIAGLSFAVAAQKDDGKKPPKPPPPVIKPGEGKKPPKSDEKSKKPAVALAVGKIGSEETE